MSTTNRHWLWYTLSYTSALLIAADCFINAYYYMHLLHHPLIFIVLAAASGLIMNALLYANDGPSELPSLLSLKEMIGDSSQSFKRRSVTVFANVVALASGIAMAAFTMTSYLALLPHLSFLSLGFAVLCSIGYLLGTYALIRRPLAKALLGSGSSDHLPGRILRWVNKGSLWTKILRGGVLLVAWTAAMGALALTMEQFGIGTLAFFQSTLGLHQAWIWVLALVMVGLLAFGEIIFNTESVLSLLERLPKLTLNPRVWLGYARQHPLRAMVVPGVLAVIVLNGIGNGAIASGAGFLSSHVPLMVCALLGATLSILIMTKAAADVPSTQDGLMPQNRTTAIKAAAVTMCVGAWILAGMACEHLLQGSAFLLPSLTPISLQIGLWVLLAATLSAAVAVGFQALPGVPAGQVGGAKFMPGMSVLSRTPKNGQNHQASPSPTDTALRKA